jgi:hypothetical protein
MTDKTGHGTRIGIAAVILLISLVGGRIVPSFTNNWLVGTISAVCRCRFRASTWRRSAPACLHARLDRRACGPDLRRPHDPRWPVGAMTGWAGSSAYEQAVNGYTKEEHEIAAANVGKALADIKAVQSIIDQMVVFKSCSSADWQMLPPAEPLILDGQAKSYTVTWPFISIANRRCPLKRTWF